MTISLENESEGGVLMQVCRRGYEGGITRLVALRWEYTWGLFGTTAWSLLFG
jgi:hypothetical protein